MPLRHGPSFVFDQMRLAKIEKKSSALLSGDFDAEEVLERIEKAEKDIKAIKAAAKSTSTKK
jgi:hypothetical protein